jgi:hypothetical protein
VEVAGVVHLKCKSAIFVEIDAGQYGDPSFGEAMS